MYVLFLTLIYSVTQYMCNILIPFSFLFFFFLLLIVLFFFLLLLCVFISSSPFSLFPSLHLSPLFSLLSLCQTNVKLKPICESHIFMSHNG